MNRYTINYRVEYYNGSVVIEAESAQDAQRAFDARTIDELVDHCQNVAVDLEELEAE